MKTIHKLVFVLSRNGRMDADDREFVARVAAACGVAVPTYLVDAHFGWPLLTTLGQGLERFSGLDPNSGERVALAVVFITVLIFLSVFTRGAGSTSKGRLKENLLFVAWTFATLMGAPLGVIYLAPPLIVAGASVAVTVAYALVAYSMVPEEERG